MKHALELHKATDENPAKLDHATKEVLHYREALWHGFENLKRRPLLPLSE